MTVLDLAAKKYEEEVARLRLEVRTNLPLLKALIEEMESLRKVWAPDEKPWTIRGYFDSITNVSEGSAAFYIHLANDGEWWSESELGGRKLGKTAVEAAVNHYEYAIQKVALSEAVRSESPEPEVKESVPPPVSTKLCERCGKNVTFSVHGKYCLECNLVLMD